MRAAEGHLKLLSERDVEARLSQFSWADCYLCFLLEERRPCCTIHPSSWKQTLTPCQHTYLVSAAKKQR